MKVTINTPKEIEVCYVQVRVHVRFKDEDMPYDYPLRAGDIWEATIEIDTGKIENWPSGADPGEGVYLKVCDEGEYKLLGPDRSILACKTGDYVPHGLIPGEYGDYLQLDISLDGKILNWPTNPDLSSFFEGGAK